MPDAPTPMKLPRMLRDPGFVRRLDALARATTDKQTWELLSQPLVADRPFEVFTHCPRGHMGEHSAGFPPTNHNGSPYVARRCVVDTCDASWLERLDP